MKHLFQKQSGVKFRNFTLIELFVVIAIIAITTNNCITAN